MAAFSQKISRRFTQIKPQIGADAAYFNHLWPHPGPSPEVKGEEHTTTKWKLIFHQSFLNKLILENNKGPYFVVSLGIIFLNQI